MEHLSIFIVSSYVMSGDNIGSELSEFQDQFSSPKMFETCVTGATLPLMSARPQSERPQRFRIEALALARKVRELRIARGWTLDRAAQETEVDLKYLQRIETGAVNMTLVTIVRIAEGYGVEMRDLFSLG